MAKAKFGSPKHKAIADFKAVYGGGWKTMTQEQKSFEWANLQRLNKVVGRKVYLLNPWGVAHG